MTFPADPFSKAEVIPNEILTGLKKAPLEVYKGKTDYMCIYEKESDIREMTPNLSNISRIKARGIIVTAPGNSADFVSRFFAPQSGIPEDPVTGSAHTTLTPYWVKKFDKNPLQAVQLSERGGKLNCRLTGDNMVEISGNAILYLEGEIIL
jgi:PhzF family phenazine biosynthesis protein